MENIIDIDLDEFLPLGGNEEAQKPFIEPDKDVDMSFVTEKKDDNAEPEDVTKVIEELDNELFNHVPDNDETQQSNAGRKKIDKNGLVEIFQSLIDEKVLMPFDEDKALSDYTMNDFKELFVANMEEQKRVVSESIPKEFFEALPDELKYAAEYVANGGNDMKGLFKALAQSEEVKALDPKNPNHQVEIVRQYLYAKQFGEPEFIEDQIQQWVDGGLIEKQALQFKPKLNQMEEEVVQSKIKQAENAKKQREEQRELYFNSVLQTLKSGNLNGIKLDSKSQNMLWDGLTSTKYVSSNGAPTNLLGKLLTDYQNPANPRYDLIAEALWLLNDPEDYKKQIRTAAINETNLANVKKLKSEQERKLSSSDSDQQDDVRKIKRQQPDVNFFKK